MYKYECSYCEDPLCPEICPESVAAYQKFIDNRKETSEEKSNG